MTRRSPTLQVLVGKAPSDGRTARVACLIDAGLRTSVIARPILDQLGLVPGELRTICILTNGTGIDRQVAEAYLEVNGRGATVPVAFGEPGDANLVAGEALHAMGWMLHPFTRELLPLNRDASLSASYSAVAR